jgi:predicted PurR-regulated permease PerM
MTPKILAEPNKLWWFIPAAVIFTLLAFGQLFGFFGVLLALPASAALLVGLRHLGAQYRNSSLYKK